MARRLALNWGVYSLIAGKTGSTDELINNSVSKALDAGFVNKGDLVVIAAGIPVDYAGTTNMLKVHIVGDILVQGKGKGNKPGYGVAHVVNSYEEAADNIDNGEILVAKSLDDRYIELLDKINGIITEAEDFSSAIAIEILKREIPIIYKAADATNVLKTGAFITVDAQRALYTAEKSALNNSLQKEGVGMIYRELGNTGLKVSVIGFGGIPVQRINVNGAKEVLKKLKR